MIDPKQLHRSSDPETSRMAAGEVLEEGTVARMCKVALDLLLQHPGQTAAELEQLSGLTDGKIRKRLNDLRHRVPPLARTGPDRRCAVTGKLAQTWYAVSAPEPPATRQATLFPDVGRPEHWRAGW
jgi:hypothetical protein